MKKVILFGAGNGGLRVLNLLTSEYCVIAFSDNEPGKHGTTLAGLPVVPPDRIPGLDFDIIIITNFFGPEIRKQLVPGMGIPDNKVFDYHANDFYDARIAVMRQCSDEIREKGVQGNVAEVGVYLGDFAKYLNRAFPDRKLYLFDTFEGFHEKDVEEDRKKGYSESRAGQYSNSNLALVLEKMVKPDLCVVRKGYFPATAEGLEDQFAFVSLDVDLYQPIYDGLAYFYPRLSPGGYIFVHDYNNMVFRGVKEAVRQYCSESGACCLPLCDTGGTAIICR
jgi:O-methyltransferase